MDNNVRNCNILPFNIGELDYDIHNLKSDEMIYLSTSIHKYEIDIDVNEWISDFIHDEYSFY